MQSGALLKCEDTHAKGVSRARCFTSAGVTRRSDAEGGTNALDKSLMRAFRRQACGHGAADQGTAGVRRSSFLECPASATSLAHGANAALKNSCRRRTSIAAFCPLSLPACAFWPTRRSRFRRSVDPLKRAREPPRPPIATAVDRRRRSFPDHDLINSWAALSDALGPRLRPIRLALRGAFGPHKRGPASRAKPRNDGLIRPVD